MPKPTVILGIKEKQPTAIRFAADAAIARGAVLRIVHCVDVRVAGDFVSVPTESWRSAGEAILEDARDVLSGIDPAPPAEYVLDDGLPFHTLRDAAGDASLVVVGVDAAGWLGPLFGGSVTERLITHAPSPVAIVPERYWPKEASGPVFVAIDARSPAAGPLRFAFTEADRRGSELHVAHVMPEDELFSGSMSHRAAVSEVLAGWREQYPDVHVKQRTFFDDAADGCVRVTEEAELLVLGRRRNHVFGHPVLAEIATRSHCPSVVVPDEWDVNAR